MANCTKCGAALVPNKTFCGQCGHKVGQPSGSGPTPPAPATIQCPSCGSQTRAGKRFCGNCRFDLSQPAVAPHVKLPPVTPVAPPKPVNWRIPLAIAAGIVVLLGAYLGLRRSIPSRPGGGDSPGSGRAAIAGLSDDQNLLRRAYGPPERFSVALAGEPSAQGSVEDVRLETWAYPKVKTEFVFRNGKYAHTHQLPPTPPGAAAPNVLPESFSNYSTRAEVDKALQNAPKETLHLPDSAGKDSSLEFYQSGAVAGFRDGKLVYLETVPMTTETAHRRPILGGLLALLCGMMTVLVHRKRPRAEFVLRCEVGCMIGAMALIYTAAKTVGGQSEARQEVVRAVGLMNVQITVLRQEAANETNPATKAKLTNLADEWWEASDKMQDKLNEELAKMRAEGRGHIVVHAVTSLAVSGALHGVAGTGEKFLHHARMTEAAKELSGFVIEKGKDLSEVAYETRAVVKAIRTEGEGADVDEAMNQFLASNIAVGLRNMPPEVQRSLGTALIMVELRNACPECLNAPEALYKEERLKVFSRLKDIFEDIGDTELKKRLTAALDQLAGPDLQGSVWTLTPLGKDSALATIAFIAANPRQNNGIVAGTYTSKYTETEGGQKVEKEDPPRQMTGHYNGKDLELEVRTEEGVIQITSELYVAREVMSPEGSQNVTPWRIKGKMNTSESRQGGRGIRDADIFATCRPGSSCPQSLTRNY
jgi:hypothetical protein